MRRGWLLAAFLTVGGAGGAMHPAPAEAATVRALSPGQLADRSTVVFIGTVERQSSRFEAEANHVVTETVFAVEQVVKGEKAQRQITLTQLGGSVGEGQHRRATEVPGYARFTVGERVMLFLEPTTTGRLVPTGLAQGKYRLEGQPGSDKTMAVRDLDGLHLVAGGPVRHLFGVPQDPNHLTLDQLLRIVRGERPVDPVPLRRAMTTDVPAPNHGEVAR